MTTATSASPRTPCSLAAALLLAALLSACAGSEATEASPSAVVESGEVVVESRSEIGPRALDIDAAMMLVVDALDVSGDDIFVRVRVVNGSDQFLNVEDEDDLYGPLLVIRDDRNNAYLARAVEPAGVDSYTVGSMRFRVDGPFDPVAEEFTVEVATSRGRLATEPIAAPDGDAVRWLTESPTVLFSDLVVRDQDNRTVHVTGIVDRGTHIDVSVEASDPSAGFSIPDDVSATLTLADGTELESLVVLDPPSILQSNEFGGVLRFLGAVPAGPGALTLTMAGIDIEIPLNRAAAADRAQAETIEPPFADPPRLPDLLHFDVTPELLSTTTITI